jgi:uncharacterized protein YkwD
VCVVLVAVAFPGATSAGASPRVVAAEHVARTVLERPLVARINAERKRHGLTPLHVSAQLRRAAKAHAADMGHLGFFSHDSANGSSAIARILRYYPTSGSARWAVGETLLWRSPDVSADQAIGMWLRSPSHRHILLDPAFREVGLSAVHISGASGVYGGLDVTIVVADFGLRA